MAASPAQIDEQDRPLRISVIIPTFQRRELVLRNVRALARQAFHARFEIIVVVDGSTDGSAEALRRLEVDFPISVLEHPNHGLAFTRNRGAAAARGEILLFLDDDMEADPRLLAEHDRSHREGADVVLGHIPLHPESPDNVISRAVGLWTAQRTEQLSAPGAELTLHDMLGGQISVSRDLFAEVGGFDTDFTRNGSFGNEDLDFGYRLWKQGRRLVFNPLAVSFQHYVVGPRHHLKQYRDAGRADVVFAQKHPEEGMRLFKLNGANKRSNRFLWRPLSAIPALAWLVTLPLKKVAVARVESGRTDAWTERLFWEVRAAEYWRGVQDAGGMPGRSRRPTAG